MKHYLREIERIHRDIQLLWCELNMTDEDDIDLETFKLLLSINKVSNDCFDRAVDKMKRK